MKFALVGDALRSVWRRIKEPVLAGRGNVVQRLIYHALARFVADHKRLVAASDLETRALWLMYHPEVGILPCEGWRMKSPPQISGEERAALAARFAEDSRAVEARLGLETVDELPSGALVSVKPRVAVHVHAFFPELLPRIAAGLSRIPFTFDLYVSAPEGVEVLVPDVGARRVVVEHCPNRGRDIAPLVCLFGKRLAQYDYVAHFHTKKSPHVLERRDWLQHVISCLLGGKDRIRGVFRLMENGYGMVAPADFRKMTEDPTGWLRNLSYAEALAKRGGLDADLRRDFTPIAFPQGSMFWARSDFLRRFLEMPLSFGDFPEEPVGIDGSPAHALERMLFLWGVGGGFKVAKLSESN